MDELLTVRQTAQRLAVSENTVRLWLSQRRLPRVKLGKCVRIPADKLAAVVAKNSTPAAQEEAKQKHDHASGKEPRAKAVGT